MKSGISKLKERNLLSRLKKKSKDAFIETYDLYVDDIHRFVYFKIGSKEEANDLTSIIFLKAWEYIRNNSSFDTRSIRALIYKIARTTIVDYYRDKKKNVLSLDDEEHPIDVVDDKQDIVGDIDSGADLELIKSKLPLLKIEYREVLIMKFVNDLSLDEIAEVTGKSKGNVRVIVFRALKALKDLIEKKN